ncbi:MAG: hypothetical protein QOD86_782 [Miltoncostaeaceae bacterium]|nr:hypothetical protein [Miltoncostaeaceae bacterium]
MLLFFPEQLVDRLAIPNPEPAIYANLAGAALVGLAVALVRAAETPVLHRGVIEASIAVKLLWAVVVIVWGTALELDAGTRGTAVLGAVAGVFAVLAALEADGLRRVVP